MYLIEIMDFRKLQAFCKVFEHRSFSKAGQELYLSQPTISAHVQGLEEELGVQLFDRLGRSVVPTGPADVLYRASVDVFRKLDAARSEIDLIQDLVAGDVSIGASTIPAHWVLPKLLSSFAEQYTEVSYRISVHGTADIITKVSTGEYDLGMVGAEPRRPGLVAQPILQDEIVAVASPKILESLRPAEQPIEEWPWIVREQSSGSLRTFEQALEASGKRLGRLRVKARVESTLGVLSCALSGLGVGVLSRIAAEADLEAGRLVAVDTGLPPIRRWLYLTHLKGRTLLPASRAFMQFVGRYFSVS